MRAIRSNEVACELIPCKDVACGLSTRGEDGAPGAAGGEQCGHVGNQNEVPWGEAREEEDVQWLLLLICGSSHGCV
jgi:hypothetical protein